MDERDKAQVRMALAAGLVIADVIHGGLPETVGDGDSLIKKALFMADLMVAKAEELDVTGK